MKEHAPTTRLADLMREKSLGGTELADLVGTSKQQINKLQNGERRITPRWAMRLAPHLGVPWLQLISDLTVASSPTQADRLAAVRHVVWRGPHGTSKAARALDITVDRLKAIETGKEQITQALLAQFCGLAGCPIAFIESGVTASMRLELVAWLTHLYPELMSDLLED